jgi:hypothetical protein
MQKKIHIRFHYSSVLSAHPIIEPIPLAMIMILCSIHNCPFWHRLFSITIISLSSKRNLDLFIREMGQIAKVSLLVRSHQNK